MKLGNLALRVLTVACLLPAVCLLVLWRRPLGLWLLVYAVTLLSLVEYFSMMLAHPVERWAGVVLGAALAAVVYWWRCGLALAVPAAVLAPAVFYLFRCRHRDLAAVAGRLGTTTFGVVYAGLLLTAGAMLKRDCPHGTSWVVLVLTVAWLGDTAAYFVGRSVGRHKLHEVLSPGKTWEGAVGGLAGSCLAAVLANLWYFPELGWGHGAVVAAVGALLGQCGDLVESLLKRACNVKDSGRLLPGHGGMLDRIDAVLFVAPWVYLYATLVWR